MSLSDTKIKILRIISHGDKVGYSSVSDLIDCEYETCREHIKELEEMGYLEIDSSGKSHIFKLTFAGKQYLEPTPSSSRGAVYQKSLSENKEKEKKPISYHKVRIGCEIKSHSGKNRWREKWLSNSGLEYEQIDNCGDYKTHIKNNKVRISRNRVIVKIPEIRGYEPDQCVWEAFDIAEEVLEWIQNKSPIDLESGGSKQTKFQARVLSQEMAVVEHTLARMVVNSDFPNSEFVIRDRGGREAIYIDNSNGEAHLESAGDRAVEDIKDILKVHTQIYKNRDMFNYLPQIIDNVKRSLIGLTQNQTGLIQASQNYERELDTLLTQQSYLSETVAREMQNQGQQIPNPSTSPSQRRKGKPSKSSQIVGSEYYDEELENALDRIGFR